jgi:hypothetical protein
MKKHHFACIVPLLLLFLFQACIIRDEAIEPVQVDVEIVLLDTNIHLQDLVSDINQEFSINGRSNSLLSEVDFQRSMKRFNSETGGYPI